MKNFSVIVDSNEKDKRIQNELRMRGIPFKVRKLNYGDYSFIYNSKSYENEIVIERKGSLDEIIGNFSMGDRNRFMKEFERARKCKCKQIHLMIEADESDIDKKKYRSRTPPQQVKNWLRTWTYKFGLKLKFVKKEDATQYILDTFQEFIKNNFKED